MMVCVSLGALLALATPSPTHSKRRERRQDITQGIFLPSPSAVSACKNVSRSCIDRGSADTCRHRLECYFDFFLHHYLYTVLDLRGRFFLHHYPCTNPYRRNACSFGCRVDSKPQVSGFSSEAKVGVGLGVTFEVLVCAVTAFLLLRYHRSKASPGNEPMELYFDTEEEGKGRNSSGGRDSR